MNPVFILYCIVFVYGIVIGSFLNVCIFRIPCKENIVKVRSHCTHCGYQLRWYDLVPLFSYIFLGGKCRKCRKKLSLQYPIIEAANGFLYILVFFVNGWNAESILYCLLVSALLVLSVIDFRTYEIPFGINLFILMLGLVHLLLDNANWSDYAIGLVSVSAFLHLIYIVSNGRGIGGGDVKLMAACGLLLGWKLIILAFILGCIIGSVVHLLRMKISRATHVLAMGPYLALGVFIAALFGDRLIQLYMQLY